MLRTMCLCVQSRWQHLLSRGWEEEGRERERKEYLTGERERGKHEYGHVTGERERREREREERTVIRQLFAATSASYFPIGNVTAPKMHPYTL